VFYKEKWKNTFNIWNENFKIYFSFYMANKKQNSVELKNKSKISP
jgi:hypothetical protein